MSTFKPPNVSTIKSAAAALWAEQDRHKGDRWRLFGAVAEALDVNRVFYPGSFVDIAPSFVFKSVTYLDSDKRAQAFFADTAGVAAILAQHNGPANPDITFMQADYTSRLDVPDEHFDMLVSLYAGLVSRYCTRYLRVGGTLLVNSSHGDVAMASIDSRYQLTGVIISRSGNYRVATTRLDSYLIPKKKQAITVESLMQSRRGVGYTKSPFAYLFTKTA